MQRRFCTFLSLTLLLMHLVPAMAAGPGQSDTTPAVTIIIDDIGNQLDNDSRAISLPGPLSYAVLPHTPYAARMARLAYSLDKDVLIHIPMQADRANHLLGPGALTAAMLEVDFTDTINNAIEAVPYAVGISNHMGSLLTTDNRAMQWLMTALKPTGLFYLDSFTNANSVAAASASDYQVPYLRRDVFLDNNPASESIHQQYRRLLTIARDKGHAIGIGHPRPQTITILNELLPQLEKEGIRLVSIREILQRPMQEVTSWQQSLSR